MYEKICYTANGGCLERTPRLGSGSKYDHSVDDFFLDCFSDHVQTGFV